MGGNIWVRPALAADDARCSDKKDGGSEDKENSKSSKDPDHLLTFACIVYVLLDFMIVSAKERDLSAVPYDGGPAVSQLALALARVVMAQQEVILQDQDG